MARPVGKTTRFLLEVRTTDGQDRTVKIDAPNASRALATGLSKYRPDFVEDYKLKTV